MRAMLVKKAAYAFVLFYFLYLVAHIAFDKSDDYQWDFRSNCNAAKAYVSGLNPYSGTYLQFNRAYPYPPHTLWFYKLFTLVNWNTAFYLFLFLKAALLGWLIYLCRSRFIGEECDALFFLFCIVAYNSPLCTDLWVGNNTVIEQCVLWSAFSFYLRRKLVPFCALVVLLAAWRITEAYFLILVLFSTDKKRYLYMVGSCVALAGILLLSFLKNPQLYASSVNGIMNLAFIKQHGGLECPSSYYFLRSLFDLLAKKTGLVVPSHITWGCYIGIAVIVISLTYQACVRVSAARSKSDVQKILVYLNCFAYVLVLPYISDYWYALLIVPTYYVMKRATRLSTYILLFILASLSKEGKFFYDDVVGLMWNYYPLLIAYAMWGIFLGILWGDNARAYDRVPEATR